MSQDYVIEVPGQYPKKCVFRVFGEDRIKQFNIQLGQDLTISFDIDAHPATAAPVAAAPMGAPMAAPQDAAAPFPPAQEPIGEGSADDLPF